MTYRNELDQAHRRIEQLEEELVVARAKRGGTDRDRPTPDRARRDRRGACVDRLIVGFVVLGPVVGIGAGILTAIGGLIALVKWIAKGSAD